MKTFFIIVISIYLLLNFYVIFRGWQAMPTTPYIRIIYLLVTIVSSLSFVAAMIGRDTLPLGFLKVIYAIGTVWLACMLYFFISFLLTDIVFLFNKWLHFLPQSISDHFRQIQVGGAAVVVFILLIVGNYRFNHPAVENYDLKIEKKAGNRKNLKVVAISDVHLGLLVDRGYINKYVDQINALHPDIVLIGGDIIDNSVRILNEEHLEKEVDKLNAPLGVYSCLGNHEYISGIEESRKFLEKTKIKLLVDEAVCVDSSFYVIGRDDRSNIQRKSLKNLVAGLDNQLPLFLLDHQPYYLDDAEKNGIDLQFSGHTHNGQLWPGNLIVKKMYELGYGYKQKGKTHVYVSSGLALWGPLFRIGTQSEMVVFNITFE